jgi:hypothetical protein
VHMHRYRVVVSGGLGATARCAFEEMKMEPVGRDTALIGDMDQAALYGVLNRIYALNLELVEVVRQPPESVQARVGGEPIEFVADPTA